MASSAPAGSPAPLAGQPPPPPLPIAQPPAVASAPATTFSPPPPPLALPPSPPLPPPAPPPSSTPVSPPPPPSATVAPSPPPLPQPVSPPAKPNSTVTPPTPPSTAAPPPASAPPPETPAASLPPPGIPTTPASPRTPPPTPSLPPAPPSRSKSKSLPQTPPPSPEKPNAPPPSAPLPATPSPPEEARPRPTETPTPPSPADSPQYPATPSPPVPPANQSSGFPPSSSASPEPPPLTPPVTPRPTPPGNSTATPPLPRQLANGSLPVAIRGQAGQRTETASHAPAGLIAGVAMGGVALIVMLGVVLFVCFKCKRKQGPAAGKASYGSFSSGVKEGASAAPPHDFQYLNQNVQPQSRAHGIVVPPRAFAPPILLSGNVDSTNSVPELHPPLVASLSFSRGNFTYGELVEATNSFSKANLLGEGGFGYVHKGVLPNGKEIAVKQLKIGSHQGQREFQAELDIISRVHHKHLVTLLGYCITGAERFLVYEFVPNNTLEYHLHGKGRPVLDWRTRLKIAIGTAKGLAYLQEDCSPTIIHRDIKAANILLDFNFEAKVSDFGLAKFFSGSSANASHISTRVVGTFGYLAPEYASSGKLTEKSDVYSFGVMLLELITGSPPIMRTESSTNEGQGLVDWARPLLNQASETGKTDKIVDPRLRKNYDSDEMLSMIGCAAACVRHSAWLRPRMSQIVRALEGEGSLADLDEGIKPGQSKVYRSSEMRKFSMILGSREDGISRQSDNTSEYGLYPSCSSSETHSR